MKRFIVVLLSLLFLASTVSADSPETKQVTGVVTSIDVKRGLITVRKKERDIVININDKTKIIECIEKDSIKDINIGNKVTVKYKEDKESNRATSVTIK